MKRAVKLLGVFMGMTVPVAAAAGELAPLQSGTFELREHTASVYYTVQSDTFEIVATLAPDGEGIAPARFVTQLMPGQTATVAVGAVGTSAAPAVLELTRRDDRLYAEIVPSELIAAH